MLDKNSRKQTWSTFFNAVNFLTKDAVRRTAEEAKRRFSDSYNALMTFDNDDLAAMDAEIDDAFDDVSSSEEEGDNEESTRDKELRRFDMSPKALLESRNH